MEHLYIEEKIISSIKFVLCHRVNEILGELEGPYPVLGDEVRPIILLSQCERTEKERVVQVDAYTVQITVDLPGGEHGERQAYGVAYGLETALGEDPALGGVADLVVLTGKKYVPPRAPHVGEGWRVVLALRVTIERVQSACSFRMSK